LAVGDLIRANGSDPTRRQRPFVLYGDAVLTHAEYLSECARWARLFLKHRHPDPTRPFHVGILLDNQPDYLFALGGAALAGAVAVGINNTRRGHHLAHDIAHTDCRILITEPRQLPLLEGVVEPSGVAPERIFLSRRWSEAEVDRQPAPYSDLPDALATLADVSDPGAAVGDRDPFVLIFTSGTATAPKAVICSHGRLVETGRKIGTDAYQLTMDDVGYLAMPLFHANALMCGFLPALHFGSSVAMIRRFSTRRWLADVRRYGVTYFNYTGKPLAFLLATPRQPDDADNPLRVCFGNEGSHRVVSEFEARFGCRVIDVFGSSEGGAGVTRQPSDPPNSIGRPAAGILVVDEHGTEKATACFDGSGRLLNPEEAIGEIVNTQGVGWFEGYYKNDEATGERTRNGWYWSGDLGYRDADGYLYFAGRNIEWIRVDGENFPARPLETILQRFAPVVLAAAYGVPDPDGGDRVMAALVLREDATFDPADFASFLAAQPDLSPKWLPTYLRIAHQLPQTATAKILKTELRRQKFRLALVADPLYWRAHRDQPYRRFTAADEAELTTRFTDTGRTDRLEM